MDFPPGGVKEASGRHRYGHSGPEPFHEKGGSSRDHDRASRAEELALLVICSYPAVREADRLAKARYLMEVETRGELDLPEHMQAPLRSMMWKGRTDRRVPGQPPSDHAELIG